MNKKKTKTKTSPAITRAFCLKYHWLRITRSSSEIFSDRFREISCLMLLLHKYQTKARYIRNNIQTFKNAVYCE